MPPMSDHPTTPNGHTDVVDADVVEDLEDGAEETSQEVPARVEETVQGVPVLAEVRAIQPHASSSLPAVQAAAVAATGFVAGAATLALVRRHSARKLARTRQSRRALDTLPIVGSRSFLVDVHLIAKPTE
jgi:hypothetical protein